MTTSDGSFRRVGVLADLDDYRLDDLVTADLRFEKEFALSSAVNFTFSPREPPRAHAPDESVENEPTEGGDVQSPR